MELIFVLFLLFVGIFIYLLPTIVAYRSDRKNSSSIFLLNLLLGWTFIGWVAALVWAAKEDDVPVVKDEGTTKICPFCAETVKAQAKVCKHCGNALTLETV